MKKIKKLKSSIVNVDFGKNVTVVEPVNLYNCKIGDNCFIGPFVEIQSNVVIENGTRIQSHTFICENVFIGKNCFIGHGVMFINDKFKNNKIIQNKNYLKTKLGDNVLIGSNSTIFPVQILNNVVIGAGSVVTKDCLKSRKVYFGNPAKLKK